MTSMKLKLDENFDLRLLPLVKESGFEADCVYNESLLGSPDDTIYEKCCSEGRILVTLDLDFANPLRFPPRSTGGIIVLRPGRLALPAISSMLKDLS